VLDLINGVVRFRETTLPDQREELGSLATGQKPDALFVACSDSRVVPNLFASTNPGKLFVIRNAGAFMPPAPLIPFSIYSERIALALAVGKLKVKDIIICAHSDCAAMKAALLRGNGDRDLARWVSHAGSALRLLEQGVSLDSTLPLHDQLAQMSVLAQVDHLLTYPQVVDAMQSGALRVHGWYYDVRGDVYYFEPNQQRFNLIDQASAPLLLGRIADNVRQPDHEIPTLSSIEARHAKRRGVQAQARFACRQTGHVFGMQLRRGVGV